jgi:hypothetical protein
VANLEGAFDKPDADHTEKIDIDEGKRDKTNKDNSQLDTLEKINHDESKHANADTHAKTTLQELQETKYDFTDYYKGFNDYKPIEDKESCRHAVKEVSLQRLYLSM